jgi:hypothetical protein
VRLDCIIDLSQRRAIDESVEARSLSRALLDERRASCFVDRFCNEFTMRETVPAGSLFGVIVTR